MLWHVSLQVFTRSSAHHHYFTPWFLQYHYVASKSPLLQTCYFFFARGDDVRWFNGRISKWKAAESGVYGGSCSAHVASSCFIKTEMLLNLSMRERERDGQTAVGECRLVPRLRKNTAFPPYTSTTPIHSTWHSMLPYFSLARATFPIFHWGWEC